MDRLVTWTYRLKGLVAVGAALLIGGILIVATGHDPADAYGALFSSAFLDYWGGAATLVKLCPLLLAGLAVIVPLKGGLFNAGAEGQIYLGGLFATLTALYGPFSSGLGGLIACALAGAVGGALWALIPALLKAYRDINEVLVTLLMNFVAINLVSFVVSGPVKDEAAAYPYSPEIASEVWLPELLPGTDAHVGVAVALILAITTYAVLRYTSYGFSLNIVGVNASAARYAGMSVRRHILMSMMCGGAMAGLAGAFEVLGLRHRLFHLFSDGYGYDGIIVAFLASANPVAAIVSATFLAGLESGANAMQRAVGVPSNAVEAIKGIVVLFTAVGLVLKMRKVSSGRRTKSLELAGPGDAKAARPIEGARNV